MRREGKVLLCHFLPVVYQLMLLCQEYSLCLVLFVEYLVSLLCWNGAEIALLLSMGAVRRARFVEVRTLQYCDAMWTDAVVLLGYSCS